MKKYLFGSFAIVMAIVFVAFTTKPQSTKQLYSSWYIYGGGAQNDVSNYSLQQGPAPDCPNAVVLCGIGVNGVLTQQKLDDLMATDDFDENLEFDGEVENTAGVVQFRFPE